MDGEGLTGLLQFAGIEALGHQGSASSEEQVPSRVSSVRDVTQQTGPRLRVQGAEVDTGILFRSLNRIEEVASVRKEKGPEVGIFPTGRIQSAQGAGFAARCRDGKRPAPRGCKYDRS